MAGLGNIRITIDEEASEALRSLGRYRRERIVTDMAKGILSNPTLMRAIAADENDTREVPGRVGRMAIQQADVLITLLDKDAKPKRCGICGRTDCHNPDEELIA